MKAFKQILVLIILSMLVYKPCMAQKTSYSSPGGWTIGLGGGYAYQKSDIANSRGFGLDFVLGSQLYQKENAFLSVDWKFRFLAGQNKAYDHRINADDSYSNIRYSFFSYDLELGLTLNRLRERSGIILTGFVVPASPTGARLPISTMPATIATITVESIQTGIANWFTRTW